MGYVAHYQQFDPEATHAGSYGADDAPTERHPALGRHEAPDATAVLAGPGERLIDLSAPRPAPVEHRRPGQARKGVLALAALAVMVAGGAGYALLRGTGSDNSAAAAAASVRETAESSPPSAEPGTNPVPDGEPAHTALVTATSPSASTATPKPSATTTAPGVISVVPVPTTAQPLRPVAPVKTVAPIATTAPPSGSASASSPATPLTATYSFRTDDAPSGPITGYVGTIRVANPGGAAAPAWTVQLTVPSGVTPAVQTGDVTTFLDGTGLTFHPSTGSIAAHSSATFSFTLGDPVDALPTACTINGTPCS